MRNFSRKNPWSRKIDYDKAIAQDLKTIADIENCVARGWVLAAQHAGKPYNMDLFSLFMEEREKARAFNVSDEDLEAYAHMADYSEEGLKLYGFSLDYSFPAGWWQRAKALVARLEAETQWSGGVRTSEWLAEELKRAKTSLARHRRNQKKFASTP